MEEGSEFAISDLKSLMTVNFMLGYLKAFSPILIIYQNLDDTWQNQQKYNYNGNEGENDNVFEI